MIGPKMVDVGHIEGNARDGLIYNNTYQPEREFGCPELLADYVREFQIAVELNRGAKRGIIEIAIRVPSVSHDKQIIQ